MPRPPRETVHVPPVSDIPLMRGGARGRTQFATHQAQVRAFQLALIMFGEESTNLHIRPAYRSERIMTIRREVAAMLREFRRNGWPYVAAADAPRYVRGQS